MLGIDTILGTVCIAEKSIYSEVLANVGRWPAFFVRKIRRAALWQRRNKDGNMNTAVTIAFYRYCRFSYYERSSYSALNTSFKKPYRPTYLSPVNSII